MVVSNSFSPWAKVTSGVPQGSILGPLLFILYINDIVSEVSGNIHLFADDTSLYVNVDTPELSASILNSDRRAKSNWSKVWLVTFNPSNTESIIFSRKKDKLQHPPLLMGDTPIATVKSHKHMGLSFSEDVKWNIHISAMVNKAWTRIELLRSLKCVLSRSSLEKMYMYFIRPRLEYAEIICDNCSVEMHNDGEAVQIEGARSATGATKLCSLYFLNFLKWERLVIRRRNN